jgi:hypothetical protein
VLALEICHQKLNLAMITSMAHFFQPILPASALEKIEFLLKRNIVTSNMWITNHNLHKNLHLNVHFRGGKAPQVHARTNAQQPHTCTLAVHSRREMPHLYNSELG